MLIIEVGKQRGCLTWSPFDDNVTAVINLEIRYIAPFREHNSSPVLEKNTKPSLFGAVLFP